MRMRIAEQRIHRGLTKRVVLPRCDLVQVDKPNMFALCDLTRPSTIVVGPANDLAIFPGLSWHQRADDRGRSLGLRLFDIARHVPAKSMHNLVLLCDRVVDLLRLIAHAIDRSTRARRIVKW